MSTPFLQLIAKYIFEHHKDSVESLCIVLPNKRGALFLKHFLGREFAKTIWLPTIISAEDLINELSGLKTLEELDLMCHLYESYKHCYGPKAESFESFAKWGQLILQDFNEIDRYLADSEQLYENLKDIKVIENWSLGQENLSEFQINYLQFMSSLGAIYKHFSSFLLQNKWAYQGLAYKQSVINLDENQYTNQFSKILFCGFNALNAAELKIFNHFYKQKKADILWDADEYYLKTENHEAGFFLKKNFEIFSQKEPTFIGQHFKEDKNIEIISVPKQIGQAMVVKQVVQKLIDQKIPLDTVAIVLANEKLLWPVLRQLPEEVEHVNVTMEYPLKYTSSYALLDTFLQLQINYAKQNRKVKNIYYKDFLSLLKQPLFNTFLEAYESKVNINFIINSIIKRNISFITLKHLQEFFSADAAFILPYLTENFSTALLCKDLLSCLAKIQEFCLQQKPSNQINLELEYLQIFIRNLNRLSEALIKYPHFKDIKSFKQLFNQVVGNATAPFIGEPLRGLQVMGVLETRTLDFEHLIIINVNEAVLPSGKSVNSFIPNDLKRAFGLPLYLEKDAIYSYHFYRLLQRASNITLTFDSETDTFGKGEKSRFISQLQLELIKYTSTIKINEKVATSKELPISTGNIIAIKKDNDALDLIRKKALSVEKYHSLSPSSLIVYKDCTLKFFLRYGAGIKELKSVEESAEMNTFGSILHLGLEQIYKPFIGKVIDAEQLASKLSQTADIVRNCFKTFFESDELSGKNLLQYEVIKVYIDKLVRNDISIIRALQQNNSVITLKDLEKEFTASIQIKINNVTTFVYIKGTVDRIDFVNNQYRIIDYKNSVKTSDEFTFTGFEKLFTDSDHNKQFQLIMYSWLLYKNNYCTPEQMLPGIIPFKEFLKEPKFLRGNDKKQLAFTVDFLNEFETYLSNFIEEMLSSEGEFTQTPDVDNCEYCDFNSICLRSK